MLGEVEEWADHAQRAAELYTQSLQQEPGQAAYYRALAAVYRAFKLANEAERVLSAGMTNVEATEPNHATLARLSVSLAQLSADRHDFELREFGSRSPSRFPTSVRQR